MKLEIVLLILAAHFVADFVCQTDSMAINKSKSNLWLTAHAAWYTVALMGLTVWFHFDWPYWLNWILLNFILHWAVDYFTSRINSYFWQKEERHWFFVGIGADQLIHYACLFGTYEMFRNVGH